MDGHFLSFYQKSGDNLFRRPPQGYIILWFRHSGRTPVCGAEAGSEHFLQFGLAVHVGQDRSLLDGIVVLIKGKGAGDALDGAGGNGIDDSLLVLIGTGLQTGILSTP